MTPLRQPLPIRGDARKLLCRGMPVTLPGGSGSGVVVEVISDGDLMTALCAHRPPGQDLRVDSYTARSLALDWTDRAAIALSAAWLSGSERPSCLWMLPEANGGRVKSWDKLTAWSVSAILVSASVARVAAGLGPVTDLLHVSEIGNNAGCSGTVRRYAHRSLRTGGHPYVAEAGKPIRGPRVDDREAVLMRALEDGAALLVEGGVAVHVPAKS